MFNPKRTLELVRGALFDPEATWRSYLPEATDWKKTAFLLTGPLIVASAVIAYLVGFLQDDSSLFGAGRPTILSTLLQIVIGAIVAGIVALIFNALAGAFRGKSNFALALAATTLAFVPGYIGQAFSGLPWIGFLLAIGLGIYALVLLWQIIPIYLEVPDGKRAGHYILSLLASIVAMIIMTTVLGGIMYTNGVAPTTNADFGANAGEDAGSGMFGAMARQAELIEKAEADTYTPPSDGELTEEQVQAFIRVMERAEEIELAKEQRLQEIAEKAQGDEQMSISDLGQMMGGMTSLAGLHTAEIEVVTTGGGNWAEHQWVRESLRTAWIQKDINDAVAHNYALYQEYEEQLANHIAF